MAEGEGGRQEGRYTCKRQYSITVLDLHILQPRASQQVCGKTQPACCLPVSSCQAHQKLSRQSIHLTTKLCPQVHAAFLNTLAELPRGTVHGIVCALLRKDRAEVSLAASECKHVTLHACGMCPVPHVLTTCTATSSGLTECTALGWGRKSWLT